MIVAKAFCMQNAFAHGDCGRIQIGILDHSGHGVDWFLWSVRNLQSQNRAVFPLKITAHGGALEEKDQDIV